MHRAPIRDRNKSVMISLCQIAFDVKFALYNVDFPVGALTLFAIFCVNLRMG